MNKVVYPDQLPSWVQTAQISQYTNAHTGSNTCPCAWSLWLPLLTQDGIPYGKTGFCWVRELMYNPAASKCAYFWMLPTLLL